MRSGVTCALALALTGAWTGAAALTPAEKCEADKLKIAGKYDFCRFKAESKAVKTASAPDYGKCEAKFGAKWASAEAKGGGQCPVNGDQAAIHSQATACTDALAAAIGGSPPAGCPGDLIQCQNDLAAAELCGNGAIDGGEECDLGTLNGATCVTQGFAGGVLACTDGCTFDVGACWNARFVDNADGTITDHVSGLTWEKKTELDGNTNFANLHDADNYYRWAGACTIATGKRCQPTAAAALLCAGSVTSNDGDPTGCFECTGGDGTCNASDTVWAFAVALNTASFAGYTDWRVPTQQELEAIFDYTDATPPGVNTAFDGGSCGAACTDITDPACSCTYFSGYWSGSPYAPDPIHAWHVDFGYGLVVAAPMSGNLWNVRAVRGGS